jgi:hypothetical protein
MLLSCGSTFVKLVAECQCGLAVWRCLPTREGGIKTMESCTSEQEFMRAVFIKLY